MSLRTVEREAAHHLGRLHQRVVGTERHAAVRRGAPHPQRPPGDALLAGVHHHPAHTVGTDIRPATELRQHVIAADGIPVLLAHPLGAPVAAGLLVGDAEVDEGALRLPTAARQLPKGHCHRRGDVQHVDGATAPHLAVDQLAAERVATPAGRVHRHHVGVPHQAQRGCRGVAALDARHHRPAPGQRLELFDTDTGTLEVAAEQFGVACLVARLGRAVVHALVADECLQQLDGGSGEVSHGRQ